MIDDIDHVDHIDIDHVDTTGWLTWEDYLNAPSGSPSTFFPPRAPEIQRAAEQAGIPVSEYGKLDPHDEQHMRTQALLVVADRLGDMSKELSRLSEEVRNNA